MSSLQCSPALQQKQNIHHVPPQNPEMFHWTSGPRHQQMAGSNWQMSNCTPVAHPNPFQHHQNPAMSEVAFYDSSMQLKMPRQSMEYSRMISPVNQGVLNSGGYYMASGVRGQQGMVQGGSMVPDNRGMPYNAQMQMNGYMGQPGMVNGRSMMPSGEMMVEKGGNCDLKMTKMSSYSQQRVSPYVNPQQYMQNKRAQYNGTQQQQQQQQVNYKGGSQPRTPLTPMWTSNTSPWPRQAPLSPNSYPPSVRQYPPNCPPQHLPSSHSPIRGHFLNGAPRSYEMLPFPGNPTPPTTPGAAGAPPFYPSPDAENRMMRYRDSEPRLCFPIRDGQIMEPFRLEHNLSVTNHIFILREHVYQSLMSRPDLELQLKCYHNEDRMMMTNWPTTLNITLNSVPLTIDRGDDVTPHQPLLLKSYCRVENNMLQIAVSACCCSHLFVVQLVHRPAVRSVLENLLNKRLLPAEHGVTKIKRAFVGNENATIKLSLVCPISKNKIALPARGHDCQHIQCFDLESYLKTNCDLSTWMCPICKKFAMLEVLEIDQYIWAILKYVSGTRFDEVVIDSKGNWKPTTYNDISDADNMALKRGMILETMLMPTMSTWLSQQSPYLGQTTASNCLTPASSTSSSSGAFRSKEQEHAAMQQGKYLGGNGAPHGSSTTDYLGCLSQLSNSILSDDSRSSYIKCENSSNSSNANNNNNNGNNHQDHVSFPPTPMGSQMSNICTPLDGQSLHPRTPSDGNPHTSPEALLHPQTPSECLLPKTPLEVGANSCNNSVGNFNSNMASASNMLDQKKGKPTGKTSSGYSTSPSKVDANNQSHEEIVLKQEEDIDFSFDLNLESLTGQDVKDNSTFGTSSNALALPESFDDDLSLYLGPSVKSEPPSTNADDLLQFL